MFKGSLIQVLYLNIIDKFCKLGIFYQMLGYWIADYLGQFYVILSYSMEQYRPQDRAQGKPTVVL